MFFNAWQDEIAQEIGKSLGFNPMTICRHFSYYISSRICTKPELLQLWEKSLEEFGEKEYTCRICNKCFRLANAHPRLIHEHGLTLDICRNCNYVVRRYKKRNPESLPLVPKIMKEIDKTKSCICCGQKYSLERYIFVYSPNWTQNIDFLFVNMYANTCFKCFSNACLGKQKGKKSDSLRALKKYADFLGHVPNRDPAYELKNLRNKNEMGTLIKLLQDVRSSHWYASEYGSYFEALVAAHVLPDGSQRMARGTRVLAVDGDLCFSMKEKAIDDFLFKRKIAHVKEALYPNCKMRSDWEIYHNNERYFVEYFGMMDNSEYAEKAARKKEICKQNNIHLVEIYPNTDFEQLLSSIFRRKRSNEYPNVL